MVHQRRKLLLLLRRRLLQVVRHGRRREVLLGHQVLMAKEGVRSSQQAARGVQLRLREGTADTAQQVGVLVQRMLVQLLLLLLLLLLRNAGPHGMQLRQRRAQGQLPQRLLRPQLLLLLRQEVGGGGAADNEGGVHNRVCLADLRSDGTRRRRGGRRRRQGQLMQ
jgi:hypothetical protein